MGWGKLAQVILIGCLAGWKSRLAAGDVQRVT